MRPDRPDAGGHLKAKLESPDAGGHLKAKLENPDAGGHLASNLIGQPTVWGETRLIADGGGFVDGGFARETPLFGGVSAGRRSGDSRAPRQTFCGHRRGGGEREARPRPGARRLRSVSLDEADPLVRPRRRPMAAIRAEPGPTRQGRRTRLK